MAKTVAVLVPDAHNPHYEGRWQTAYARYEALFSARDLRVEALPWTRLGEGAADLTLVELAWGYHRAQERFEALLRAWPAHRRLVNPAPLILWNMRKTYLTALETAGVAVIPTVFVDNPTGRDLADAAARFGCGELVVKPQVSAGAHDTLRVRAAEPSEALPRGPCMIQPFLPAVGGEGELSLFVFAGAPAYAVRKVAAPGDFRIQPQYGGRLSLFEPDAEALALALVAVAACPLRPAYARCDMVRGQDGRLQLMELECIEPDLYLDLAPDRGEAFVDAVLAAGG